MALAVALAAVLIGGVQAASRRPRRRTASASAAPKASSSSKTCFDPYKPPPGAKPDTSRLVQLHGRQQLETAGDPRSACGAAAGIGLGHLAARDSRPSILQVVSTDPNVIIEGASAYARHAFRVEIPACDIRSTGGPLCQCEIAAVFVGLDGTRSRHPQPPAGDFHRRRCGFDCRRCRYRGRIGRDDASRRAALGSRHLVHDAAHAARRDGNVRRQPRNQRGRTLRADGIVRRSIAGGRRCGSPTRSFRWRDLAGGPALVRPRRDRDSGAYPRWLILAYPARRC